MYFTYEVARVDPSDLVVNKTTDLVPIGMTDLMCCVGQVPFSSPLWV